MHVHVLDIVNRIHLLDFVNRILDIVNRILVIVNRIYCDAPACVCEQNIPNSNKFILMVHIRV